MYLISPRYIKRGEEVKIGRILDRIIIIGEGIDHLVEKEIITVIEVMDEVEVISGEVVFEAETVLILEEITVGIEIEKTGGLGDNQDQEKEEWQLDQNRVPDQDQT